MYILEIWGGRPLHAHTLTHTHTHTHTHVRIFKRPTGSGGWKCAIVGVPWRRSVSACLAWGDLFVKHMLKQVLKRLSLLRHHGTPTMAHLGRAHKSKSRKHFDELPAQIAPTSTCACAPRLHGTSRLQPLQL